MSRHHFTSNVIVYHTHLVHGNPLAVEGIVLEDGAALLLGVAADIHRRHPPDHLLDPRAVAVADCLFQAVSGHNIIWKCITPGGCPTAWAGLALYYCPRLKDVEKARRKAGYGKPRLRTMQDFDL